MDLQTSHLAAALMSGPTYNNIAMEAALTVPPSVSNDEVKSEKPRESEQPIEEKEEAASGEDFTDEVSFLNER